MCFSTQNLLIRTRAVLIKRSKVMLYLDTYLKTSVSVGYWSKNNMNFVAYGSTQCAGYNNCEMRQLDPYVHSINSPWSEFITSAGQMKSDLYSIKNHICFFSLNIGKQAVIICAY